MSQAVPRYDVRELILDIAEQMLRRFGYRKTTVEDIAREAHLSRGTLYLHFRGKEGIALAWTERFYARLRKELTAIAESDDPASARLRQMLLTRVIRHFDRAQPYEQSVDDILAALRPSLLSQRERAQQQEAEILARVLADGRGSGEFAFEDSLEIARLFLIATDGLLPLNLSAAQFQDRVNVVRQARELVDLLLAGIARVP